MTHWMTRQQTARHLATTAPTHEVSHLEALVDPIGDHPTHGDFTEVKVKV